MEELKKTTLNSRLKAITEAQNRARFAFFISTLASGIVLAALWNTYLSWDRQWADVQYRPSGWGQEQLISQQIKSWMENQLVGVPLLGIHLSASDAAVLGSIALLILSFYYCMCMRRENHEIGSLLKDIKNENDEVRRLVFFKIRSFMVFNSISDNDAPIRGRKSSTSTAKRGFRTILTKMRRPGKPILFSRVGFKLLIYLPALTVLLIICSDIYFSLWFVSPWRHNVSNSVWSNLSATFKVQLVLMDTIAILLGLLIFDFCMHSSDYHQGTREITEDLGESLGLIAASQESSAGASSGSSSPPSPK
jgi:hypothetical protein